MDPGRPSPTPLLDAVHGTPVAALDASNVDLASAYAYKLNSWK